jgi:L-histidine N-alpha-methyltransferase
MAWSLMRRPGTRLLPERMTSPCVSVAIHPSLFPEAVQARLLASFQTRRIHGAFHYDTARRAHRWMQVHATHSPAVTADDARSIYDQAARESVVGLAPGAWGCIGLGCGSGHKEARVAAALAARGSSVTYLPLDVSVPLVLISREAALAQLPNLTVHPIAADLTDASDLSSVINPLLPAGAGRFFTLFGMLPNFEPEFIFGRMASWLRPGDRLLFSANLAPGPDLEAGVRAVLPQYDNPETKAWLRTLLEDHGVSADCGSVVFHIEPVHGFPGCARIAADWVVSQSSVLVLDGESFPLLPGERLRLFFSCRHTPGSIEFGLRSHGLRLAQSWIAGSGEEGVFYVERLTEA